MKRSNIIELSSFRDAPDDDGPLDLRNITLDGRVMVDYDFAGVDLRGANMSEVDARGCHFENADMVDVCLNESSFEHCDFSHVRFGATDVSGTRFAHCRFAGVSFFTLDLIASVIGEGNVFIAQDGTVHPVLRAPVVWRGFERLVAFIGEQAIIES